MTKVCDYLVKNIYKNHNINNYINNSSNNSSINSINNSINNIPIKNHEIANNEIFISDNNK